MPPMENREYVVKRQPYLNVPVYMVCPRDGKGHSQTLHRNYLLPISPNLEQNEKDAPMAGVGHTTTSAPVPSVDSVPADAELSGTATSDTTGNTLRVVQINLLHSDAAHIQPRTNSHGGTGTLH